jgi:hypothetical protein
MTASAPVEIHMRELKLYPAPAGGWIYEVWIAARPVVVGWCQTREAALHEANLA